MNAVANGIPAARPIAAEAATSAANGSGAASATAPAPPAARLAATQRRARRGSARRSDPPRMRVKKPSRSVSEPAAAAEPFECPCRSSSVTTQFPAMTLKENDAVWIAANRYSRASRKKPQSNRSPA